MPGWSILPRKMKTYFQCKAWANPDAYVRWRGLCGQYEARAALPDTPKSGRQTILIEPIQLED